MQRGGETMVHFSQPPSPVCAEVARVLTFALSFHANCHYRQLSFVHEWSGLQPLRKESQQSTS
eukprot:2295330-Amphidinium_carterae.1